MMYAGATRYPGLQEPRYNNHSVSPSSSTISYRVSQVNLIRDFFALLNQWRNATRHESNLRIILEDDSFISLVGLGRTIIRLMLEELRREPSLLVFALEDILNFRPYDDIVEGNIGAMTRAWLNWAGACGELH
jgi:hypothetical protein